MSKLLALGCGNTRMLTDVDPIEMSEIERKVAEGSEVELTAYLPEYNDRRLLVISGLHYAKDGWGVTHIVGTLVEEDGVIEIIFYDNPAEADPLNLK